MIFTVGQIIPIEMQVKILAPFAFNDRIFYIVKPLKSYADTVWIISSDGSPLENLDSEFLNRASKALENCKISGG